jgi:hypothetical protein
VAIATLMIVLLRLSVKHFLMRRGSRSAFLLTSADDPERLYGCPCPVVFQCADSGTGSPVCASTRPCRRNAILSIWRGGAPGGGPHFGGMLIRAGGVF